MNKILNINLGGFAFTIDDDAFQYLSSYLDSIRRRFSESEGRDEILSDIEMRLGELVSAELGNRTIVMLNDVEAAVQIMGKPEDFGAEPIDNRRNMGKSSSSRKRGKRLYRDEEDNVAGGVCSGLAAYFGMSDPVWMRLIFVLLTFISAGFWIPAYILLWILVPPAKTAADRLAMRGEPINVDNIAREVEDGFEKIGDKVSQMSQGKKKSGVNEPKGENALAAILNTLGQIFALFIRFFAKFGLLILVVIAAITFVSLIAGWLGSFWGLLVAAPYIKFFSPFSSGLTYLGVTNVFFLLAIPAIGLGLLFARFLFKINTPVWLSTLMAIVWGLNLISALMLGGFTARSFRHVQTIHKPVELTEMTSDTLRIERSRNLNGDLYEEWIDHDNGIRIVDENLEIQDWSHIVVRPSKRGRFECVQEIRARGKNYSDARDNANSVQSNIKLKGNTLNIPDYLTIPNGKKFRAQDITVKITVPVGKYIVFGEDANHNTWNTEYADDEYRIGDYPNRVFQMTEDGLVCTDCPTFGESDYRGRDHFENFFIEGNSEVEIRRGDDFTFTTEGDAEVIPSGKNLTVNSTNGGKVVIETENITDLFINGNSNVTLRGFDEHRAALTIRGNSQVKGYFDCSNLKLNMSGPCSIELFGKGRNLEATLNDGASLNANSWRTRDARITANNKSSAKVFAEDDLEVRKDAESSVENVGKAEMELEE